MNIIQSCLPSRNYPGRFKGFDLSLDSLRHPLMIETKVLSLPESENRRFSISDLARPTGVFKNRRFLTDEDMSRSTNRFVADNILIDLSFASKNSYSTYLTSVKRIVITGPESSGKTTLAMSLATTFETAWVPEFARNYLEVLDSPYTLEDLVKIAIGQVSLMLWWLSIRQIRPRRRRRTRDCT